MDSNGQSQADPAALAVARTVQEAVRPNVVILFGSRAVGDYRPDSDVDLLVINKEGEPVAAKANAYAAAQEYMRENPPWMELGIISMSCEEFARCRLARQHLASQAENYGVNMSGERLNCPSSYNDDYPDHWAETRNRVRDAEEWHHQMVEMYEANHWNKKLQVLSAQQAVENALKGWLSVEQDDSRYGHDLEAAWKKLEDLESWSDSESREARESVTELLEATRYTAVDRHGNESQQNWLTLYAATYRYGGYTCTMSREEQFCLTELSKKAVTDIIELLHARSGTTDKDAWPEGAKPWEL